MEDGNAGGNTGYILLYIIAGVIAAGIIAYLLVLFFSPFALLYDINPRIVVIVSIVFSILLVGLVIYLTKGADISSGVTNYVMGKGSSKFRANRIKEAELLGQEFNQDIKWKNVGKLSNTYQRILDLAKEATPKEKKKIMKITEGMEDRIKEFKERYQF